MTAIGAWRDALLHAHPAPPAARPRHGWHRAALAAGVAILLSGCTPGDGDPPAPAGTAPLSSLPAGSGPAGLRPTTDQPTVAGQLNAELRLPWSTVFLPDGTAVISERDTALLRTIAPGAGNGPAGTLGKVPDVVPGGEGGLLGLAVSPDFARDRYLYAYFTAESDNRIARLQIEGSTGALRLGVPEVIFTGIPKASTHNGGRIRFGPDGQLYVGTGDSQRRGQPQDPKALGGKILRITPDGRPTPGNPFDGNPVYSLGHRNVQGLDWDSSGRLWASEFGPDVDDELNLIVPGGNYGWPEVTGSPHRAGFLDAKVVWPSTADSSPSGLEIVGDTAYLGALRGQRVWAVPLNGEFAGDPVSYFTGKYGRIRDVALAPDGRLWVLSNNKNPDFVLVLALPV
ncbi:PQQ-dependent sugar dehydrogenase [Arthrobacter sp. H16F315]|uniref:PQQ-dependent sugar dehydrogenase n=1 Tax=Arthrobacter sp. H16F315 TaxID=2955314 RepID=UPI002096E4F4|nr:PQQ-dependent sugar dehydrogenase [Arthrobacter sp. H16F315]MDD1477195.1 PQQ-dependent sugar dehydrogenase [Arthrobacter sp. H16F315]